MKTGPTTVLVDRDSLAELVGQSKLVSTLELKEAKFPTNVIGGLENAVGEILEAYRKSHNA